MFQVLGLGFQFQQRLRALGWGNSGRERPWEARLRLRRGRVVSVRALRPAFLHTLYGTPFLGNRSLRFQLGSWGEG